MLRDGSRSYLIPIASLSDSACCCPCQASTFQGGGWSSGQSAPGQTEQFHAGWETSCRVPPTVTWTSSLHWSPTMDPRQPHWRHWMWVRRNTAMVFSLQSISHLLMMNLMMRMMTSTLRVLLKVWHWYVTLRVTLRTCDTDMWQLKQHPCTCHYTRTHTLQSRQQWIQWFASHLLFWSCGICFGHWYPPVWVFMSTGCICICVYMHMDIEIPW